jgi:hypothetical protein
MALWTYWLFLEGFRWKDFVEVVARLMVVRQMVLSREREIRGKLFPGGWVGPCSFANSEVNGGIVGLGRALRKQK